MCLDNPPRGGYFKRSIPSSQSQGGSPMSTRSEKKATAITPVKAAEL